MFVCSGSDLSDGQWHTVELICTRGHVTLTVDGDEGASAYTTLQPIVITQGTHLYFGGKRLLSAHGYIIKVLRVRVT